MQANEHTASEEESLRELLLVSCLLKEEVQPVENEGHRSH